MYECTYVPQLTVSPVWPVRLQGHTYANQVLTALQGSFCLCVSLYTNHCSTMFNMLLLNHKFNVDHFTHCFWKQHLRPGSFYYLKPNQVHTIWFHWFSSFLNSFFNFSHFYCFVSSRHIFISQFLPFFSRECGCILTWMTTVTLF